MPKLLLEIPKDIVDALRLPPGEVEGELRKELALALYQRGALSSGKACALVGMTRWAFEHLLRKAVHPASLYGKGLGRGPSLCPKLSVIHPH